MIMSGVFRLATLLKFSELRVRLPMSGLTRPSSCSGSARWANSLKLRPLRDTHTIRSSENERMPAMILS
jgi:hypothetical protein